MASKQKKQSGLAGFGMDLGNIEVQDIDAVELTAEDYALLEENGFGGSSNDAALLRELETSYGHGPAASAAPARPAAAAPVPAAPAPVVSAAAPPSTGSAAAYSSPAPAPVPVPAPPPQVVVSPEALAMINSLASQFTEVKKKAQSMKAAGKNAEAAAFVKEAKELQEDIEKLKKSGTGSSAAAVIESVKQRLASRKSRAGRETAYLELRQALISYYKSRTADLNLLIAKLRLPGLPNPKRHELSSQVNALKLEKTKLEGQIELLEVYYRHASMPPCPLWRWDTVTEKRQLTNDDVAYDQLELSIHSLIHGREASNNTKFVSDGGGKCDLHVAYALPVPADSPSTGRTAAVKPIAPGAPLAANGAAATSAAPAASSAATGGPLTAENGYASWEHTACYSIKRAARTTMRAVEKRPAVFEVYKATSGFLGFGASTVCIAKGAIPLDGLLSDSTIDIALPLHAPEKIPDAIAVVKGDAIVPASVLGAKRGAAGAGAGSGAGAIPAAGGAGGAAAGSSSSSSPSPPSSSPVPPGAAADDHGAVSSAIIEGERGSLHVSLRLHVPLRDQALQFVERKVLVMQELPALPLGATALPPAAPLPAVGLVIPSGPSAASHASPTSSSAAAIPSSSPAAGGAPRGVGGGGGGGAAAAAPTGVTAASREAAKRDAALIAAEFGATVGSAGAYGAGSKPSPAAAGSAAAPVAGQKRPSSSMAVDGPSGAADDDDDDGESHMDLKHFVSVAAIEKDIERCNAILEALKKSGKGEAEEAFDIQGRVAMLEMQKSGIETRIVSGALTFDGYLAQLKTQLKNDAALAKSLIASKKTDAAAEVMERIRAMKGEIAMAEQAMAGGGEGGEGAPAQ